MHIIYCILRSQIGSAIALHCYTTTLLTLSVRVIEINVHCLQALCAILEYELCPSGEDKLDVITTLHRTNVGRQCQSEVAAKLRLLKQMVSAV